MVTPEFLAWNFSAAASTSGCSAVEPTAVMEPVSALVSVVAAALSLDPELELLEQLLYSQN